MSGFLFLVAVAGALVVVLWLIQNEGHEAGHRGFLLGMRRPNGAAEPAKPKRRGWRRPRGVPDERSRWRLPGRG